MDKIIVDNNYSDNKIVVNKDSYILISDGVQAKELELNIIDCKVKILDSSSVSSKIFNFTNADANVVEVIKYSSNRKTLINSENSNLEFDVIDLMNSHY